LKNKKIVAKILAGIFTLSITMPVFANEINTSIGTVSATSDSGRLVHLSSYVTGLGQGSAEIVAFSSELGFMYVINSDFLTIDIVDINEPTNPTLVNRLDVAQIGYEQGFSVGDVPSVAVNNIRGIIGIAVQHENHMEGGYIVLATLTGEYISHFRTLPQPDNIVFSPNGNYVLTADEGEPITGIFDEENDPISGITFVRLEDMYHRSIDFTEFDNRREELISNGVILQRNVPVSRDLEPEYIAFDINSTRAFISLQEANSIATFDLENYGWISIYGLGIVDHNQPGFEIDINRNEEIIIQNENVFGIRQPDGIAAMTINGTTYVLTANEGDAREWGDFLNTFELDYEWAPNLEVFYNHLLEGVTEDNLYILGSRSFSIFRAETNGSLTLVFDSGSQFEKLSAEIFPFFNSNHSGGWLNRIDGRSHRKGSEPESIQVLTHKNRLYAIIGLERQGGIFMFDVTNPYETFYVDYINVRDLDEPWNSTTPWISGDLGAEGIAVVTAENSPIDIPLILVANEISGTVSIFAVTDDVIRDSAYFWSLL